MQKPTGELMDKLISLCKRRGYIFQSSEIYGGINSCWDYGPYGVLLKKNIKDIWWHEMTQLHPNIIGFDSAILMHPDVWRASGHLENFTDPLVECKKCHHRFKQDTLTSPVCPDCGGELTKPRLFNLMFKTHIGPIEDEASTIYLRPETAQGIYLNFLNIIQSARVKPPFGVAQIGKAFRNEISPGNFIFRTREFEQMEMQYFVPPEQSEEMFEYWKQERMKWYISLGIRADNLRFHEHNKDELAHYAKRAVDIEYSFPFGWKEIEGIHNRGDFDLKQHSSFSGKELSYFDTQNKRRYIPHIIETSGGVDRTILVLLLDAYEEEPERVVLKLHPKIAPLTMGVFPLVKRERMPEIARRITENLREFAYPFYDESGSIGRRYRRMDELGTPFCITVDSQTLKDNTVTIRDRDTMEQIRVHIDGIMKKMRELIKGYERNRGFK
ncbi:glycine--tRNA ligase [bacterium]|nr:glycine--tRNA ligase [bacterium]